MEKSNVFKSSSFHMDVGDILHMILKDEKGTVIETMLIGSEEGTEVVPNAPVASAATDITSSSFTANWNFMENTRGYYLDVATDSAFTSMVTGFDNLNVGNAISYSVTGLDDLTTYYYRLRAYNDNGISVDSSIITIVTAMENIVDKDGNAYTYVNIGTQQWMVENLKTTKYADGASIPNLVNNGITDWFLPSKDELHAMYEELYLYGVGILDIGGTIPSFWSSSEYSATEVWVQDFDSFSMGLDLKYNSLPSWPCRSFTSTTNYNLRDIGPSGGWIFHKDGNNYMEACPEYIDFNQWSNITDIAIGTTGTAIGTGQANTTAIIGQAGHVDSAAKFCNDLDVGGWKNDTIGAYCWYNNDIAYKTPYGALYNWFAVDNASKLAEGQFTSGGSPSTGWRIPTSADWNNLTVYLGGQYVAGGKLKEIGTSHWTTPNTGATNEYGFKALPGGQRDNGGSFIFKGTRCDYAVQEEESSLYEYSAMMTYLDAAIARSVNLKQSGFSVRCVRDIV